VQHDVATPFPSTPLWIFFPGNTVAFSEEQGEKFHQDISRMEKDTAVNGTQMCWLITAGRFYGRHQQKIKTLWL
jgi:hypothetical protein